MAGWSAIAGTHNFVVADETHARSLAEALAAHGFPHVTASGSPGGWRVTALDEGPYPADIVGNRMMRAVARDAALIARRHSGYPAGGSQFDVSHVPSERRRNAPIVCANPGARPPVPPIVAVDPPPRAALALTPDHAEPAGEPVDLVGLDAIAWAELGHAHGSAEDVPGLLRSLGYPSGDWDATLDELFADDLLHQGSCYSATAAALPFLTQLIESGALPAKQRLDLYMWLIAAAGEWSDGLLGDADRAAAQGRRPRPAPWTDDVNAIVGEQVPQLLARWDIEPPAVRFMLACLAGLYPFHGQHVSHLIAAMAEELDGTQAGAYLRLAAALVDGSDDAAMATATEIVAWADGRWHSAWQDAAGLTVPVRAGHVLANGALDTLDSIG